MVGVISEKRSLGVEEESEILFREPHFPLEVFQKNLLRYLRGAAKH